MAHPAPFAFEALQEAALKAESFLEPAVAVLSLARAIHTAISPRGTPCELREYLTVEYALYIDKQQLDLAVLEVGESR